MKQPPVYAIEAAVAFAVTSPCRSKRGVVIWGTHFVSGAHNSPPAGFACTGDVFCKATCATTAVHAEQRALLLAGQRSRGLSMLHVKTVDGELVASDKPRCVACSKLILDAGITTMWLYLAGGWRSYTAAEFHALSLANSGLPAP